LVQRILKRERTNVLKSQAHLLLKGWISFPQLLAAYHELLEDVAVVIQKHYSGEDLSTRGIFFTSLRAAVLTCS